MKARAVLVLGMHRCGTSAVTRCLGFLGADLGSELLAPAEDNPTGFWEDLRFLAINRRLTALLGEEGDAWWEHSAPLEIPLGSPGVRSLLAEAAGEMERRFASRAWWAFKDPRTLRALPFWEEAASRAGARMEQAVVVRHPLACARSLGRRNGLPEGRSLLLWTSQYLAHWPRIAARPFVAVDYDRLLEEPERELRRLGGRLGLPWREAAVEEARGFLRPDLRHARFEGGDLRDRPEAPLLVAETFEALGDLCADREPKAALARMTALHAEFRRGVPLLRALDAEARAARVEQEGWIARIEQREEEWAGERRSAAEREERAKREAEECRREAEAERAGREEAAALLAERERELALLRARMEGSRTWRLVGRLRGLERSFRSWRRRLGARPEGSE